MLLATRAVVHGCTFAQLLFLQKVLFFFHPVRYPRYPFGTIGVVPVFPGGRRQDGTGCGKRPGRAIEMKQGSFRITDQTLLPIGGKWVVFQPKQGFLNKLTVRFSLKLITLQTDCSDELPDLAGVKFRRLEQDGQGLFRLVCQDKKKCKIPAGTFRVGVVFQFMIEKILWSRPGCYPRLQQHSHA